MTIYRKYESEYNRMAWDMAESHAGETFAAAVDNVWINDEVEAWLQEASIKAFQFNSHIMYFYNHDDAIQYYLAWGQGE